jgi:hypothetical protein
MSSTDGLDQRKGRLDREVTREAPCVGDWDRPS